MTKKLGSNGTRLTSGKFSNGISDLRRRLKPDAIPAAQQVATPPIHALQISRDEFNTLLENAAESSTQALRASTEVEEASVSPLFYGAL
jgi:hypothetical protein